MTPSRMLELLVIENISNVLYLFVILAVSDRSPSATPFGPGEFSTFQ